MKWRPRWSTVMIALAVIAALAIASPVLGLSQSIKKAIKKEVAKQIAKATGPAGPGGPGGSAGANGTNGAPGPPAAKLDFDQAESDDTFRVAGAQNELTVEARCDAPFGNKAMITWRVTSSVAGTINWTMAMDENGGVQTDVLNGGEGLSASTPQEIVGISPVTPGEFRRGEVQAVYRNDARVITLNLHMIANDASGRCQLNGTAVPAS